VAKWARLCQNGLKMSGIVPLEHPKRSKIFFGKPQHLFLKKHIFHPSLTLFWSQTSPFLLCRGRQRLTSGSKLAGFTCLCTPNGPLSNHVRASAKSPGSEVVTATVGADTIHPTWRPRPDAPPVTFWLKTWIWQGHHLGS
jgi:hypothetical protein